MALSTSRTPSPLETLTTSDTADGSFIVSALPDALQALITDYEAPEFVAGHLSNAFQLRPEQRYAVARFLMELVLGKVTEAESAARLADLSDTDIDTAGQMLQMIEEELLAPNNLQLIDIIQRRGEPHLVADLRGNQGLRYDNLNDLLADVAAVEQSDRMRFMEEAKPFNRIYILQAFSQLKMGADASGRPLSFREQVAREVGQFSAQDWIDLLRVDPDVVDEPAVWAILRKTALGAAAQGRDAIGRREISSELAGAADELQVLATSPVVGSGIDELVQSGVLPETHAVAVGRVVFFLCIGKLVPSQTAATLERIGVLPPAAATIAQKMNALLPVAPLEPQLSEPAAIPAPQPTRTVPAAASRNIIDLRKQ